MAFYFQCFSRAVSKIPFPGWPQTWKTWKTQGICKIVTISGKTQGNFNFFRKNLENSEKMKNMGHDHQQKYILLNFPLLSCSGKKFKVPWKSQGNSGNLVSQKCGHPDFMYTWLLISANMAFGIPTELLFWISEYLFYLTIGKICKCVVAVEAWFLPSETIFATSIKLLGLLPIIWCIYQISALNIYAGPSN